MARVFLVVMDSVGIGGAPDADRFFNGKVPDTGANTVAHIARACAALRSSPMCRRNPSVNCRPMVKTGLRAVIGS